MTDTIQAPQQSLAQTDSAEIENPVAWMHQCIDQCRHLEKMAQQVDSLCASRDTKVAHAQKQFEEQIDAAERDLASATSTSDSRFKEQMDAAKRDLASATSTLETRFAEQTGIAKRGYDAIVSYVAGTQSSTQVLATNDPKMFDGSLSHTEADHKGDIHTDEQADSAILGMTRNTALIMGFGAVLPSMVTQEIDSDAEHEWWEENDESQTQQQSDIFRLSQEIKIHTDQIDDCRKSLKKYKIHKKSADGTPQFGFLEGTVVGTLASFVFVFAATGSFALSFFISLAIPGSLLWHHSSLNNTLQGHLSNLQDVATTLHSSKKSVAVKQKHESVVQSQSKYDDLESKLTKQRDESLAQSKAKHNEKKSDATKRRNETIAQFQSDCGVQCATIEQKTPPLFQKISRDVEALASDLTRSNWASSYWTQWDAAEEVPACLRIGAVIPEMPRFRHHFSDLSIPAIPALVDYKSDKGIVIVAGEALDNARQMAQSAICRLLATVPPAGVKFVFIDPVSLGGNVAGFMKLENYEPTLIGGKAWSDARHIEQALTEVTDHMETVIQKYLREDYKTIADYNATARVKEAYRVVVVFDFPVNFSESSAKRLASIMRNGPRCGVFPIVIVDSDKPLPYGFNRSDLDQFALVLQPANLDK